MSAASITVVHLPESAVPCPVSGTTSTLFIGHRHKSVNSHSPITSLVAAFHRVQGAPAQQGQTARIQQASTRTTAATRAAAAQASAAATQADLAAKSAALAELARDNDRKRLQLMQERQAAASERARDIERKRLELAQAQAQQAPKRSVQFATASAGAVTTSRNDDADSTASSGSDVSVSLPAGWRSIVDPKTSRTFYFNQSLNKTQWDKPTAATSPRAAQNRAMQQQQQRQQQQALERQRQQQQQALERSRRVEMATTGRPSVVSSSSSSSSAWPIGRSCNPSGPTPREVVRAIDDELQRNAARRQQEVAVGVTQALAVRKEEGLSRFVKPFLSKIFFSAIGLLPLIINMSLSRCLVNNTSRNRVQASRREDEVWSAITAEEQRRHADAIARTALPEPGQRAPRPALVPRVYAHGPTHVPPPPTAPHPSGPDPRLAHGPMKEVTGPSAAMSGPVGAESVRAGVPTLEEKVKIVELVV